MILSFSVDMLCQVHIKIKINALSQEPGDTHITKAKFVKSNQDPLVKLLL